MLIVNQFREKFEGWHPTLGEFNLIDPSMQRGAPQQMEGAGASTSGLEKFGEVDVTLRIRSIAPLEFESIIAPKKVEAVATE